MVVLPDLVPNKPKLLELLNNHISLPDVEVAVAQSDHASISIKGERGAVSIDLQ